MEEKIKSSKMDERLKSVLSSEYSASTAGIDEIIRERSDNLKYYNLEPVGVPDPGEGKSRAKTSDVADTVDWIMPQLQKLLASQDAPVEFLPLSADDVEKAKQETAYVKHVLDTNRFFLTSVVWHKDALIQKNGVIKAFWEENTKRIRETYNHITALELQALEQDEDIEIHSVAEVIEQEVSEMPMIPGMLPLPPEKYFDVVAFRTRDASSVKIVNVAPENFFVRKGWNTVLLDDIPYCAHRERIPLSDLKVEGLSDEEIEDLEGQNTGISDATGETEERFIKEGGLFSEFIDENTARKEVWVTEHFIRFDYDEDGIDELLKVRTVGDGGSMKIIDKSECDGIPFIVITPDVMPHIYWGRAVADNIRQLQDIKTVLLRQTLDNIYLTNTPRNEVRKDMVDLDSLFNNEVGAPVYTTGPDAIKPLAVPFVANNVLAVFEYVDQMREERSGVSKQTQGLDPAALKDQTNIPAMRLLTAAQERILMIARVFAEVGYVGLFLKIHELIQKNEKEKKIFELRGEYVEVDPREWTKRSSMRVLVGTGNQTREERLAGITQVLAYQEKIVAAQGGAVGMVTLANIHAALSEFCDLAGIKNADTYFTHPDKIQPLPPPEPQMDSATQVAMADIQSKAQTEQAKLQADMLKSNQELALKKQTEEAKIELERQKMVYEGALKQKELETRAEIDALKIQLEILRGQKEEERIERESFGVKAERNSSQESGQASSSDAAIDLLVAKIESLEEKINSKKTYNFNYDKQGKIVGAESEVSVS